MINNNSHPAKPRPYQKEGVWGMEDFLEIGSGVLLADDMGLGKTLQALWLMRRARVGNMFPALVVCPANVKYGWEYQSIKNTRLRAQVFEGRKPPPGRLGLIPRLMVINPDILPAWVPYLERLGLQTLVLDECQFYGNPRSQRTKAAITLARQVPYRVALSGTPLTNRPAELWPTLHMLRPDKFRGFFSFAQDFCRPRKRRGKWEYKGAKNLPKLHALLKRTCMIRRLKRDVEDQLPEKTRQVVPMELGNYAEYVEARDNFTGWLHKNYKGRAKRALKAAAVTQIGYLLRLTAKLKCRAVVDWANRWLEEYPGEKIVLFAVHKKMVKVLQRRVKSKHVTIDGSVTGRRRGYAVEQFRRDPTTRVLIGNIKAAGVGVDGLQDVCSTGAFTELWWVPGMHIQAEDRLWRIGQEGVTWISYLVAGGTIEEDLCSIIQRKQKIIHGALDGQEYEGDLNVFDQLIKIMETKNGTQ
jgi:SWI/SNF-related matrix-associated actin-dependent regulator 1 of chromatin subfamily A